MEREFVSYEQAVALEKIGYNTIHRFESAASLYSVKGHHCMYTNYGVMYSGLSDGYISAPLKQQAFRWLYQKTNKWIIPIPNDDKIGEWFGYGVSYSSFEKAEDACINKLIEIVKQQADGTPNKR